MRQTTLLSTEVLTSVERTPFANDLKAPNLSETRQPSQLHRVFQVNRRRPGD